MTPTLVTGRATKTDASRQTVPGRFPRIRCGDHSGSYLATAGFSLLEVLVVVFIIGILATMFTLSVGVTGGDRQLDTEVDRLIAVIALANEEAVIQGREIGMRITSDGYRFATYQEDFIDYPAPDVPDLSEWLPIDSSNLLGPRQLPDGLLFELRIDGREIVLKSAADEEAESAMNRKEESAESAESESEISDTGDADDLSTREEFEPQIMIFSSGDMNPFVIHLRREFANAGATVEFDLDGSTEVSEDAP